MLLGQTRLDILNQIKTHKILLSSKIATSTAEAIATFENALFLDELEACLSSLPPTEHLDKLRSLFAKRWERIRNSSMDYTQNPFNKINLFCLDIAKKIAPLITDGSCLGPYFILMPSLKVADDIYGNNIHDFALHQFVLGDGERVFIPIEACIERISISDRGELQHLVSEDGRYQPLSPTEKKRLVTHSTSVSRYLAALEEYNNYRIHGQTLEAKLQRLHNALLLGGAQARGKEFDSGSVANIAIAEFFEYWRKFSKADERQLYLQYPRLQEVIGRLFRPEDANYQEIRFCVEKIAELIELIIANRKMVLSGVYSKIKVEKKDFLKLREPVFECLPSQAKLPNIWESLYQTPLPIQAAIFAHSTQNNAWSYALEFALQDLTAFKPLLDSAAKLKARTIRLAQGKTPLMVAASAGYDASVGMLLDIGVPIEAKDNEYNTALILAAAQGHLAIVKALLAAGAEVDAVDNKGNTALMKAIIGGHHAVVEALLEIGVSTSPRNLDQKNALQLAEGHPEILKSILLKGITLSIPLQAALCSSNSVNSHGRLIRHNVLIYAANQVPSLFNTLLEQVIKLNNEQLLSGLYYISAAPNGSPIKADKTILMLAAIFSSNKDIICALIDTHHQDVGKKDSCGNTALILAAAFGHSTVVKVLLEKHASLKDTNHKGNTALHEAIIGGHGPTVEALLAAGADINSRNHKGQNAIDLAKKYSPALLEPLLLKAFQFDPATQAECLRGLDKGIYKNVLTYVRVEWPHLLTKFYDLFPEEPRRQLTAFLNRLEFDKHFRCINAKYNTLSKQAENNPGYRQAAVTAKQLVISLAQETTRLFNGSSRIDVKKSIFQMNCISHIDNAKDILSVHRGWKGVLTTLLLVLVFPISVPLLAAGFFSTKTDSLHKLMDFEMALNQRI